MTFNLIALSLISLLLIAAAVYFIVPRPGTDALALLAGVTLGKGARVLLNSEVGSLRSEVKIFLVGSVGLLAFASWWHLDMTYNFYHGPRWMGLWNNPNIYGMLMSAGVVIAIGMLAEKLKAEIGKQKAGQETQKPESRKQKLTRVFSRRLLQIFLGIAVFMMGLGLVMSYSRGSWLGTAIGLLYLAWCYGKLKWRYVLPGVVVLAAVVFFFWSATPDTAPWYVKRMDLGRPSAQHRVAAWRGALQMMLDHPFGVGWNNAVSVYDKNYSPPEGGAAAITTNDYLMLGTQLGWPGLICFVSYVALCFRTNRRHLTPALSPFDPSAPVKRGEGEALAVTLHTTSLVTCHSLLRVACRSGALAMLVAFWFDGGLFTLATAAVFWILLEVPRCW